MKRQFCKKGHNLLVLGRESDGHCKECRKEYRHTYTRSPEAKATLAQWEKTPSGLASIANRRFKAFGILNADGTLFKLEDYNKLFSEQEGKCSICKKHQSELSRALAADHDHNTNVIRGLLCTGCNIKLGFKEQTAWNDKAEQYLKAHIRGTLPS